jgi:predicted dehydrogenase
MGVISDLGSHLLDTLNFFLKIKPKNFELIFKKRFENKSPDHALILHKGKSCLIQLEVSLCMWRNTFNCDLIFENGSIHIDSLCKWGPSKLTIRQRKFPSGIPKEINKVIISKDPTWEKEYKYFKHLITNKINLDLSKDIWISEVLSRIEK